MEFNQQTVYQVITSDLDHNYVEEMEEEPVDATTYFKHTLNEIRELKEIILGMKHKIDDQETQIHNHLEEIKEIVERNEAENRELRLAVDELRMKLEESESHGHQNATIARLPNIDSNKSLYSNIDAFESWVQKNEDNIRATIIEKRDMGVWPKAEDAIANYFTKSKFRSFYTKSRAVIGKRTFNQSVFCNLIKECYDDNGLESMTTLVDKFRKTS